MTVQLDTKRMRACAPLLPAPGDRAIVECLDEIEQLQSSLSAARAEVEALADTIRLRGGNYNELIAHELRAILSRHPAADGVVVAWRRLTSRGTVINGWNDGPPSDRDRELAAMDGQLIELAYSRSVNASGNLDARTLARKATVYVGRPQAEYEAIAAAQATAILSTDSGIGRAEGKS